MRQSRFLIVLALVMACEKSDDSSKSTVSVLTTLTGESGIPYSESLMKWNELKAQNGNAYKYQTTFSSWAGFGSTTELTIADGQVVERSYQAYTVDGNSGEKQLNDSYAETVSNLGTNELGAAPLTIDELYRSCAAEYLVVSSDENSLYFETEVSGLMTLCGFVPKGCQDDCYQGVRISAFDWMD